MSSFGENLKRERESRHVSLSAIAAATKISVRQLQAIEDEDFSRLPGGIFNRSFVRAYARHVGLDEERTVHQFLVAAGETPDSEPMAEQPVDAPRAPLSANAVVAILLLFVFGLAAWGVWRLYRDRSRAGITATSNSTTPSSANVSTQTTTQPAVRPAETTPSLVPSQVSSSTLPAPTGPLQLEISVSSAAWVRVVADEHELFARVLPAGTTQQVSAQHTLHLTTGNAGVTHLQFNQQPVPALGNVGEIGRFDYPRHAARAHVAHPVLQPAPRTTQPALPTPPSDAATPPPL